ncbi:hypothetical protein EVAR_29291_1 [Eumeta japonica]|uniref:Uncharacterized protein n=1 Tax=Eumeta variegata TaxID=151549 RepID=A0A4C1VTP6_EUMVA|nr:hypothetical protein EVAR_29291_1 [Eumeta japonica]
MHLSNALALQAKRINVFIKLCIGNFSESFSYSNNAFASRVPSAQGAGARGGAGVSQNKPLVTNWRPTRGSLSATAARAELN